jgi:hypothetical protein
MKDLPFIGISYIPPHTSHSVQLPYLFVTLSSRCVADIRLTIVADGRGGGSQIR